MGYMNQIPSSNFYQSKPSSPNTPRDEDTQFFSLDESMTQSNPTYPNEFTTELPYSVNIDAQEPTTHFSMEKLDSLFELSTALEEQKVLTMEIALEADLVMGGTQLGNLYFSGESKQQKYAVAMEAISGKMALGIAAIVGAVLAAITAAIAYFSGKNDQAVPSVDNSNIIRHKQEMARLAQSAANRLSAEQLEKLSKMMQLNEAAMDGVKSRRAARNAVAQELHSDVPDHTVYAKQLRPFEMDHLSTGEYSALMGELLKTIDEIHPIGVLQDARLAYREMVAASKADSQQAHNGQSNSLKERYYQLLAKPREAHRQLMEQINKLKEKKSRIDAGQVELPKDINHALRHFVGAVTQRDIVTYANERLEIAQELERMRKEAQALQVNHTEANQGHGGIDQHGREVLSEVHGLLAVMIHADMLFQRYWKSLDTCANYLYWVATSVRYQVVLDLKQKGHARDAVMSDSGVQQLDSIIHALSSFRQKAK
jgi:hypothetical protein